MKAISLWQPWASAIAIGSKRVETRHWSTNHRGKIAIHAAKRKIIAELRDIQCEYVWCGALYPLGIRMCSPVNLEDAMPFGAIVAVADLTDCRRTESFTDAEIREIRKPQNVIDPLYGWTENDMGNFADGRFGWVLNNVRALAQPLPWRGAQGLFEVPDHVMQNLAF